MLAPHPSLLALALALALGTPGTAQGQAPPQLEGPSTPALEAAAGEGGTAASRDSPGKLSSAGTDNGALELGLGVSAAVIGVGLLVAGSVDLSRGLARRRQCEADPFASVCTIDGPGLIFASTGLAYTFAVPALIGAGLLLRRGVRVHRDFKAVRALRGRTQASVWFSRGKRAGGGLNLRMRF